ncbi:hypothetical protein AB1K70_16320 [Bremerella sp. JC770]|uniref:hypothetical protein n=1 Tax=Bremerella sp. JC770 TaxID=3232137 RepID=UPI0034581F2C
MTEPYIIRLNGPWEMTAAAQTEPTRVKLPAAWSQVLQAACEDEITLKRWFHRPTGIDDGSQVELHLIDIPFHGQAWIDDASLGEFPATARHTVDIKSHLSARCCLSVAIKQLAPLERTIPTPQISLAILPAR